MLSRARDFLNKKPWMGWILAGVLLLLSAIMLITGGGRSRDFYDPDRMKEIVTIRFEDTGEEMEIPRGRLLRELVAEPGQLDPTKGFVNPKTGKPTGYLYNKSEWDEMIARINQDKEDAKANRAGAFSGEKSKK